jgi:hypothetical protein
VRFGLWGDADLNATRRPENVLVVLAFLGPAGSTLLLLAD